METVFEDRALVILTDNKTVLVLSDLHLGFEHELYETKGVSFPSQHNEMLERISALLEKYSFSEIYIVGDVKHTITAHSHFNWSLIPEFMSALADLSPTYVIPGNHDGNLLPLLPRKITVVDVHGIVIGEDEKVGLVHGHAWPAPNLLSTEILVIGHNHPTLRNVRNVDAPDLDRPDRRRYAGVIPVVLKSKLDKNCVRRGIGVLENLEDKTGTLITLPSFNKMFAGLQVNTPKAQFHGPVFENQCANLLDSEIYSTSGVYLGTVKALRERFNEIIK
ncbi:MAG: metallophosphoesterase [Candidatus Thorarchaeota archaeon]|jgi:putative SbcD/Mre11-related phosphoesterase